MTVEEKKKQVEEFLQKQEGNQEESVEVAEESPEEKVEEKATTPAPFAGRYKSDTGLFRGGFEGNIELPEAPVEEPPSVPAPTPPLPPPSPPYDSQVEELLAIMIQNQGTFIGNQDRIIEGQNKIVENQEVERIEYERMNPLASDSPVYDWNESLVPPGYIVTFTLIVPEGSTFFFEYFNISFEEDTVYNITIDGIGAPTLPPLTEVLMDFGDHYNNIFNPPRLCYDSVIVTALNNGDEDATYSFFIRGFLRNSIKLNREYIGQR